MNVWVGGEGDELAVAGAAGGAVAGVLDAVIDAGEADSGGAADVATPGLLPIVAGVVVAAALAGVLEVTTVVVGAIGLAAVAGVVVAVVGLAAVVTAVGGAGAVIGVVAAVGLVMVVGGAGAVDVVDVATAGVRESVLVAARVVGAIVGTAVVYVLAVINLCTSLSKHPGTAASCLWQPVGYIETPP